MAHNRDVTVVIPTRLVMACRQVPARAVWLARLPETVRELERRWRLTVAAPFQGDGVSCAWVAPARLGNGQPAVLKLGIPHMEGAHEIHGLAFWDGDPTVRLLEADVHLNAMLLESCKPGDALRGRPEREQEAVIATLLRRLWRRPAAPHPFRPLAAMTTYWAAETTAAAKNWPDAGVIRAGLRLFEELSQPAADDVLLGTDVHAGNVLRSSREPWLVIDPKPFIGDRAYDATQHLFNCRDRLAADPHGTIRRLADFLELDDTRVRLWMFARAAAEPRDSWHDDSLALARVLA